MFNNEYKSLGVMICGVFSNFQKEICHEFTRIAKNKGYNLAIFTAFNDYGDNIEYILGEANIANLPPYEQFDGMIVIPDTYDSEFVRDAMLENVKKRCHCPVVSIRSKTEDFYNIIIDNDTAMEGMVRHFIVDHKLTKIAFLNGPKEHQDAIMRYKSFVNVMNEYNIPINERWVYNGDFWKNHGDEYRDYFLEGDKSEWPEAIVCANDYMAIALCGACLENGIKVPEDILISGFDNIPDSKACYPPITTVSISSEMFAIKAFDVIESVAAGAYTPHDTYVDTINIYRKSCGCNDTDSLNGVLSNIKDAQRSFDMLYNTTIRNTFMSIALERVDDYSKIGENIGMLEHDDRDLKDFYLCLCEGKERHRNTISSRVKGYPSTMKCIHAINNRTIVDPSSFKTMNLLPDNAITEGPVQYYFTPLHFLDSTFGYVAHSYTSGKCYEYTFQSWLITISNGLENIRSRRKTNKLLSKLNEQYLKESMTGLYNRRGFDNISNDMFDKALVEKKSIMLVEIDMDNLKKINDMYGHSEGDVAIDIVSNALKRASNEGEICSRVGGDEFWVIAYDYDQKKMDSFVYRFYAKLKEVNALAERPYVVSASYGSAITDPESGKTLDDYMNLVDERMYIDKCARKKGRK